MHENIKAIKPSKEKQTFQNIVKKFFPTAPDFPLLKVPYNCGKCDKSFSNKSNLKVHIDSVHKKVRYNCEKCEKNFGRKENLKKHIQSVHLNYRPHKCDKCDKSFIMRTYLENHVKSAHENVRYNCDKCDKSFSWKNVLKLHIKNVHQKNCDDESCKSKEVESNNGSNEKVIEFIPRDGTPCTHLMKEVMVALPR